MRSPVQQHNVQLVSPMHIQLWGALALALLLAVQVVAATPAPRAPVFGTPLGGYLAVPPRPALQARGVHVPWQAACMDNGGGDDDAYDVHIFALAGSGDLWPSCRAGADSSTL